MNKETAIELPFADYLSAVDAELERVYAITVMDAGIELGDIASAQESGWTPEEYVEWFAERYGLESKL